LSRELGLDRSMMYIWKRKLENSVSRARLARQ